MKIDNPIGDPDCARHQYSVRFELRKVEDLHFDHTREAFERMRRISEWNESLYRAFVTPWVRAPATPWLSASMHWLHPMRSSRYLWSEPLTPWMGPCAVLAEAVSQTRRLLPEGPLIAQERRLVETVSASWAALRRLHDATEERVFTTVYGGRRVHPSAAKQRGSALDPRQGGS
jgi:hypothetical protein